MVPVGPGNRGRGAPVADSIGRHVVEGGRSLEIEDLRADSRVGSPYRLDGRELRHYAGVPVRMLDTVVGTLSVMNKSPRRLNDRQMNILSLLAKQVTHQLNRRWSRDRTELKTGSGRSLRPRTPPEPGNILPASGSTSSQQRTLPDDVLNRFRERTNKPTVDSSARPEQQGDSFVTEPEQTPEVPDRRSFLRMLGEQLIDSTVDELAVFVGRIRQFSRVEETHGYQFGDWLMNQLARRFQEQVPDGLFLAEFGRGTHAGFLTGNQSGERMERVGTTWIELLEEFSDRRDLPFALRGNVGIVRFPDHGRESDRLVSRAHRAVSRAEQSFETTVQVFHPDLLDDRARSVSLERDFERALQNGNLEFDYQPRIDLANERVTGAEALIRWEHPERGPVSPGTILELAETTGRSFELDRYVLRSILEKLEGWRDDPDLGELTLFMNLTYATFLKTNDFVKVLGDQLDRFDVPPSKLELEVTEQHALGDVDHALVLLNQVHERNVRVALDDFGTGYSSLEYLSRFPLDVVKVDRDYIVDIDREPSNQKLVRAIFELARELDLEIVAEGPERRKEVEFLNRLNCDYAQGYFYSRPLPARELKEFVSAR